MILNYSIVAVMLSILVGISAEAHVTSISQKDEPSQDAGMMIVVSENPTDKRKLVLLGQEKKGDAWRIIEGAIGSGESFAEAARRKAYQETARTLALDLDILKTVDADRNYFEHRKPGREGNYRLYKMSIDFIPSQEFNRNLRKLEAKIADARAKKNRAVFDVLRSYSGTKAFMWITYDDLLNALKKNTVTFSSKTAANKAVDVTIRNRDFKRLTLAYPFLTAGTKPKPSAPLAPSTGIMVFGDFGNGKPTQKLVAATMKDFCDNNPCDYGVTTGDNLYPNGVEFDKNGKPDYQPMIERVVNMYKDIGIPLYPALGNHDINHNRGSEKNIIAAAANQINFTKHALNPTLTNPRRAEPFLLWNMPDRFYKTSEKGNVTLYAIETNIFPAARYKNKKKEEAQRIWLNQELSSQVSGWKIVYGHVPILSHGKHGLADKPHLDAFRESIIETLCSNRVDFYLSGHDHHLEIDKYECPNGHVLVSILSGAGGQQSSIPKEAFVENDPHLLWVNGSYYDQDLKNFDLIKPVVGMAHINVLSDSQAEVTMTIASKKVPGSEDGIFSVVKGQSITRKQ